MSLLFVWPVELLSFPPAYCIVGAYRLVTDESLWKPIWFRSRSSLQKALYGLIPFALISWPLTRIYVSFLARSPFTPANIQDAAWLGVPVVTYTTAALVLGQISAMLEWVLRRSIKKSRKEVYEATVRSRGKSADFWMPYFEEWSVPPVQRAKRNAEKQSYLTTLGSPLVRMVVLKVLLTPLSFIPFLNIITSAALRCLTLGRVLHKPFFAAKKMTPFEIELFMVERQTQYRMFGFVAAIMERIPIFGIVFGISNSIGSAMWAHDLEKQQHAYRAGDIPRTKVYESKTAALAQEPRDLPEEFAGGFPTKKGPVRIEKDGTEIGL